MSHIVDVVIGLVTSAFGALLGAAVGGSIGLLGVAFGYWLSRRREQTQRHRRALSLARTLAIEIRFLQSRMELAKSADVWYPKVPLPAPVYLNHSVELVGLFSESTVTDLVHFYSSVESYRELRNDLARTVEREQEAKVADGRDIGFIQKEVIQSQIEKQGADLVKLSTNALAALEREGGLSTSAGISTSEPR